MNHIIKISSLILLTLILASCSKDGKVNDPVVEITAPGHKQLFLLPGNVSVSFNVKHDRPIEYIRVSVVNKNMTSVSDHDFLYPESNEYHGDVDLPLSTLPEAISLPPYYVHVVVSDFSEINHTYLEIELMNGKLKYKGCFLIERPGIDMLNINYFNAQHQKGFSTGASGNYSGSGISANADMLYLITGTPHLARAFHCENGELAWTKDPQLPYPEFNRVLAYNNIVYFSTGIGRIIGLTGDEGTQVFTTPVLPDSIPVNMCTTANYLVADFKSRNSNSKLWVTFYKQTGSKCHVFPTNYETIALHGLEHGNKLVAFCNDGSTGQIITFDAENNIIENKVTINNNVIQQSCKIGENDFLFSTDNKIFRFNGQDQSYAKITETTEIIVDMKFDHADSRLFVVHPNKAVILSYPGLNEITTIETPCSLKGVELKFGH